MLFNHVTTSVISTHRLLFLSFGLQLASAAAMLSWVISLLSGCTSQAAGISSLQVSIVWLISMVCFYLISEASLLPPLLTVFLCFVKGWWSSFFFRHVIVFGGWLCSCSLTCVGLSWCHAPYGSRTHGFATWHFYITQKFTLQVL